MSSFQINGQDPPNTGAIPPQTGYNFIAPSPVGMDPRGRPIINDHDTQWLEISFPSLNKAGWDWYCGFLDSSHRMYGQLTSIRVFDLLDYDNPGGPKWVVYSGDDIYLHQPTYGRIEMGVYYDVAITIRGLA